MSQRKISCADNECCAVSMDPEDHMHWIVEDYGGLDNANKCALRIGFFEPGETFAYGSYRKLVENYVQIEHLRSGKVWMCFECYLRNDIKPSQIIKVE